MKKINYALVGCGRIAQRHAQHISNNGTLVAVCDVVKEKAEELGLRYGAKFYLNVDDLFNDKSLEIDVVAICSPNGLHADHSIKAFKAGCHVICEKPMALSVSDCGSMIHEAEKANRRLFAIKQNRFNPPVEAVKKVIDQGLLGRIYSVQLSCFWNRNEDYYKNSWKGTLKMDGGTLYTQFSHFIDLLYWLVGDVKKVNAMTNNFAHQGIIEFEDTGVVVLEFANGALGTVNYTVNSFEKNMEGSLTIFGELGTVKIGGQYLNELEYQHIKDYKIENLPQGNTANNYGTYQGSMSNHDKIYENLTNVLINGASISTNAFEGLKTIEIIEKIYNSAKLNNYA
jgi:predicted dehydrogenase